jgi:tRNA threonylcarbamoyladenosine biosynthesis protein TsaE
LTTWISPADSPIEFTVNSPEETFAFGQRIAAFLQPGSVVALQGELGSGKTCFVKGIAYGCGIEDTITSPTYTIINEYSISEGINKNQILRHIDVYRISDEDFFEIGGEELIHEDIITLIEWSERIEKYLPENTIRIYFKITGPLSRLIKIEGLYIQ